jgi:1-acyl-sn-glycerol-3-phosphate acyltransferase
MRSLLRKLRAAWQYLFGDTVSAFGTLSATLLVVLSIVPAKDYFREWLGYQKQYLRLIGGRGDATSLSRRFQGGIQQTWLPELAVVAKRAMMRSPLVGPLLRRCQHIDAGDGGTFGGVGLYEQALAHLRAGTPVMLFPEGTRSPERGLGEFRLGAFQIAAQARVPLIPVLIRCEPPTLMRGQPWYEIPERTAVLTISQLPGSQRITPSRPQASGGR